MMATKSAATVLSKDLEFLFDKIAQSDGLENLIAQIGNGNDKRSYSKIVNRKHLSNDTRGELTDMYRTDWISGKIVDIVPDDMTREWRTFDGEIDPKIIQQLENEETRLSLPAVFNEAHKYSRLFGTSYIILSVEDGLQPEEPMDISKIKKGGLRHIKAIDRNRIHHADVVPVADPMDPAFGFPEFYRLNETSVKIHHSRILRFDAIRLPYDAFRENQYCSDSVLDRLYESILNFMTVSDGAASMVHETNVDIVKIKNLMSMLASADGEALVKKRFHLAKLMKSFNNMLLMDTEEEYQNKTNTFSGLHELMDRYLTVISAASDIPATRLLGSSANGLNATGEGDLKNYYDMIRSKQKMEYSPLLNTFDKIMLMSLGLSEETDISYEFNSLFQMTPKEQADVEKTIAERDQIYVDMGAVNPEIVAKELQQKDTYTNMDDHIRELENKEDLGDPELEGEEEHNEDPEAQEE